MQVDLNLKIKYRESFRPFAPSVIAERASQYFDLKEESPYMTIVAPVRPERRFEAPSKNGDDLLPIIRQVRSDIPAVTHVDYSARIQTVVHEDHPVYFNLLHRFEELTGCAVIVNTSFNVRGEPIVCTPDQAYRCFMRTEMNILALGNFILFKEEQPPWPEGKGEGLENEDVTKNEPRDQPKALIKELRKIFNRDFVRLAQAMRQQHAIRVGNPFSRVSTTWSNCEKPQSNPKDFEYPSEWDKPHPNPEKLANALVKNWTPGAATNALHAILVELIALGLRFPVTEELEEEVSESVYVMF